MDILKRLLEDKPTLTIVGATFGDEGKGKIISLLVHLYDVVARFAGGGNAGHTVLTADGRKLVGHLVPCGLAAGKVCVLGRGELINLAGLVKELAEARSVLGDSLPDIWVDEQAVLWTPWHPLLESYLESRRGSNRINSTGQGIGPMAAMQKLRLGVLVGEMFYDETRFRSRLEEMFNALEPIFREMVNTGHIKTEVVPTPNDVAGQLLQLGAAVRPFVRDTSAYLYEALEGGGRILAEGAQATGLDSMWGTYPYVSSTMSTAAGASLGLGLPPWTFSDTLLVTKCMPTRVGAGPFPSEIWDRDEAQSFPHTHPGLFISGPARSSFLAEMLARINAGTATPAETSQYFQVLGDERGATTGRGRSVGWLDIPLLQYACRINGPFGIALLRLDLLSGLKKIPVVTGYKLDGEVLELGIMPAPWRLHEVEPVLEYWDGWDADIAGTHSMEELPDSAVFFLDCLGDLLPCPVLFIGTGPKEDDVIIRADTLAAA